VRVRIAALASLVILGTALTGFLLMSLSEGLYEKRTHGRLIALHDEAVTILPA
jgi:hypothetical protein